jgi:hypothetical protein
VVQKVGFNPHPDGKKGGRHWGLVWKPQTRRGLEGLKSSSYSILNKKEILASPIPFRFWTSKLALGKLSNQ